MIILFKTWLYGQNTIVFLNLQEINLTSKYIQQLITTCLAFSDYVCRFRSKQLARTSCAF